MKLKEINVDCCYQDARGNRYEILSIYGDQVSYVFKGKPGLLGFTEGNSSDDLATLSKKLIEQLPC